MAERRYDVLVDGKPLTYRRLVDFGLTWPFDGPFEFDVAERLTVSQAHDVSAWLDRRRVRNEVVEHGA